jgi:hypothetical protein
MEGDMLKNCAIAMCLMSIGSAFWMPPEAHALVITLKCPAKYTFSIPLNKCVFTGSVEVGGEGNTQGATTTAFTVVKPDNSQGVILVCRNRGGTVGSGKAFFPSNVDLSGIDAEKPKVVDKKGKFGFATGEILPAGVHPEYTPEQCAADSACAAIQKFCPNGVINGNEGKNWNPIDVTPITMKVQAFLYYCDSDSTSPTPHICTCDPTLDADDSGTSYPSVSPTSGPVNRCASATSTNTTTNTWTFAWTDISGPSGVSDGITNHYDIRPGAKTAVNSCVLPNPQNFVFGAQLPYDCSDTTLPDLFP